MSDQNQAGAVRDEDAFDVAGDGRLAARARGRPDVSRTGIPTCGSSPAARRT